jgi:hypothetical protein
MENEKLDIEQIVDHWISRSDSDFTTMNNLIKLKDFHWALFIGHLVIERLLKAAVVKKTMTHAPLTHDLRRLYKLSGLTIFHQSGFPILKFCGNGYERGYKDCQKIY